MAGDEFATHRKYSDFVLWKINADVINEQFDDSLDYVAYLPMLFFAPQNGCDKRYIL